MMKRSMVVGPNDTGVVDSIRTSAGTFINRNWDPVITAIEQRLAVWSHLPPENQEDMQVLRYGPTNKYGPHIDGLERVMSVLIYLVEPKFGGETAFPNSNGWLHPEMGEQTQGKFSDCAKGHVACDMQGAGAG
jgi:prolyl 4-hydroxylase